ncbi:hypothetical protein FB382_001246 [Nocardioides ginsengisegetis]|uniref:Uncharacterized protein n=1 Tax=Nocardioides ginsengisegetis TaxID=661491 RepID=A0A7W3IYI2_9ACTN|nr:hypothetical protein [Nocardioides ginsengisegetis]
MAGSIDCIERWAAATYASSFDLEGPSEVSVLG